MTFYFCMTDENGVQCVDQMIPEGYPDDYWTAERVADLAALYPEVIYFRVSRLNVVKP